jgi:hypothetical protein
MRLRSLCWSTALLLAWLLWPAGLSVTAQEPPRVMTAADHIAACNRLPPADRDQCLASASLRSQNPDLCATARSQACADLVAVAVLPKCARYQGPARFECELAVAIELNSAKVCKTSLDPDGCLAAVAAERRDVNLILSATKDPRRRDQLLIQYGVLARDETVLPRIADSVLHNKAAVALIPIMMRKPGFTLTPEWCRRLRALPASTPSDDAVGATDDFCRLAVAMATGLSRAMDAAETERERQQVMKAFEDALETMTRDGSVTMADIARAVDPAGAAAALGEFDGTWTCPARGTMTLRSGADASIQGTLSGQKGEHWGGDQRKGGTFKGSAKDRVLNGVFNAGDGTHSNVSLTLGADGTTLSGDWTWFRDKTRLGSGTMSCARAR